ncbi:MAG: hypothetical protein ACP5M0_11025 [Desulfomonilaceae bacterium]
MELHEIVICPEGPFGTPIRGDTLFGHFCWQVQYEPGLVEGGLPSNIARYGEQPFIVFSSAFPRFESASGQVSYALKRPNAPLSWLFSSEGESGLAQALRRKSNKRRTWMLVSDELRPELDKARFLSDEELLSEVSNFGALDPYMLDARQLLFRCSRVHNTIHRITNTTGPGEFSPYNTEISFYVSGVHLAIFALFDETVTNIEAVKEGLQRIGQLGFGMDASIGMGRFSVQATRLMTLPGAGEGAGMYCLSPSVPVPGSYKRAYFTPFVRFGKHGDTLARSTNPFKNPVIMADEGAVFVPKDPAAFSRPYWGRAVTNVSLTMPETVVQGYSIWLPMRLGGRGEA